MKVKDWRWGFPYKLNCQHGDESIYGVIVASSREEAVELFETRFVPKPRDEWSEREIELYIGGVDYVPWRGEDDREAGIYPDQEETSMLVEERMSTTG